jgi:hypothetical protein
VSSSLRRGALAAVLAVTLVPLAAACGTGDDPQTLEVKPDSVATTVGDVAIQNAYIITEPKGTGPAAVSARVFNNGTSAQQLTAIAVQGASSPVTLTGPDGKSGPLTIPAGGSVTLGGKGNPSATLSSSQGVVVGNLQNTVFRFSSTGDVSIAPSVVPAVSYFSVYGPSVTATPSVGTSASGAPSGSPSGAPSGSASANPSSSATAGKAAKTTKPAKPGTSKAPVASSSPKA